MACDNTAFNFLPLLPLSKENKGGNGTEYSKIMLRSMKSTDIDLIQEFLKSNFPITYSSSFWLQFIFAKGHYCQCAIDLPSRQIIAVVAGNVMPGLANPAGKWTGQVMVLAVHHGHRREGLGCRLLRRLESEFCCHIVREQSRQNNGSSHNINNNTIFLTVASKNTGAISFYQSQGYEFEKLATSYYGRLNHGQVMSKQLCV
ncbi:acyl-CoA N-acyltransferase [Lipomyces japonicus]|uniref:acyl-CoA N-acyltransferase n=1 Tax=Lipomyces japonicus TaxID=56871 RepID=UPI0034CDA31C